MLAYMATNGPGGEWVRLEQESMAPSPRFGASLTTCGTEILLFGGCQENSSGGMCYFSDLYRLALRLTADSELSYNWELVPATGHAPAPREGHCACYVNGELYIFGGVGSTDLGGSFSGKQIHSFSPVSKQWSVLEAQGSTPEFQNMSAVVVGNNILAFGGVNQGVSQCKLFVLDTESLIWSSPTCTGFLPTPRCDHSSAVLGQKMYVFGGSASSSLLLNDLCVLDTESLEWNPVPISGLLPDSREYCSLTAMGDRYLLLFGGFVSSNRSGQEQLSCSDTFAIDLSIPSPVWTQMAPGGAHAPSPRYSHSAVAVLNFLLVFGGMGESTDFNDLWAFRVNIPHEQLIGYFPTLPPPTHYPSLLPSLAQHPPPIRIERATAPAEVQELQQALLTRVAQLFAGLGEQAGWLEEERARVRAERELVTGDRKQLLSEVSEKKKEVENIIQSHKKSNEDWIRLRCHENDATRKELNKQRRALEEGREELARREKECQEKSQQLAGFMDQFEKLKS